jgi:hypothetical protein
LSETGTLQLKKNSKTSRYTGKPLVCCHFRSRERFFIFLSPPLLWIQGASRYGRKGKRKEGRGGAADNDKEYGFLESQNGHQVFFSLLLFLFRKAAQAHTRKKKKQAKIPHLNEHLL